LQNDYKFKEEREKEWDGENAGLEIKEDWQLSQFWYSSETGESLARSDGENDTNKTYLPSFLKYFPLNPTYLTFWHLPGTYRMFSSPVM